MANVVTRRYAVIDTFGSDVTCKTGWANILSITVVAAGATEAAHFNNAEGHKIFVVSAATGAVGTYSPAAPVKVFGLVFDDSESSLEAGDYAIVHFG